MFGQRISHIRITLLHSRDMTLPGGGAMAVRITCQCRGYAYGSHRGGFI